jgi:hypothetical protein
VTDLHVEDSPIPGSGPDLSDVYAPPADPAAVWKDTGAGADPSVSKVTITTAGHTIHVEATLPADEVAKLAEGLWERTRFGNNPAGFAPPT